LYDQQGLDIDNIHLLESHLTHRLAVLERETIDAFLSEENQLRTQGYLGYLAADPALSQSTALPSRTLSGTNANSSRYVVAPLCSPAGY